jgi:ankyrin repeat protein
MKINEEFEAGINFMDLLLDLNEEHNFNSFGQTIIKQINLDRRNSEYETLLSLAIELEFVRATRLLLEAGANPELGGWTSPLNAAVIKGSKVIVQLLIWAGADVNLPVDKGNTVLMSSARHGDLEITRILVENGADVNAVSNKSNMPLLLALMGGHEDVFQYLLSKSSRENILRTSNIAIEMAKFHQMPHIVGMLEQANIKANSTNCNNRVVGK